MPDRKTTLIWLRRDLRLDDHPGFYSAAAHGRAVLPVFIWSPEEEGDWTSGAASKWWLHHSLLSLSKDLAACGSKLIIRKGRALTVLMDLCKETGADSVGWGRLYEPAELVRGRKIEHALKAEDLRVEVYHSSLLAEPWEIMRAPGQPYKVFTAFWNRFRSACAVGKPLPRPRKFSAPSRWPKSLSVADLKLLPKKDWAKGFRAAWVPGEAGALKNLRRFCAVSGAYRTARDRPGRPGTSRLSPHLHFGEVSPRKIWHALRRRSGSESYLRQLVWREFAHHLLYYFPHTPERPLRSDFEGFPWREDGGALRAWQRGKTGYPLVDAGMRELWHTGWMHNRVRMIAASFLVKHLLMPWQEGAKWFWDTLVDADLANNTMGWQWVAGCGADAAPYFRIFNPVLQGEKFDPQGEYVRRWVPELSRVPDRWIHRVWEAPGDVLKDAGVRLGKDYPHPVVDHEGARRKALLAYAKMKKISGDGLRK